jgi:teichuronic acid biosynthesis glycosyltransferase TuaG
LLRSIQSVQAQSFADWELILVDDGSEDDTYQLALKTAKNEPRLSVLRHDVGAGVAAARNAALGAAQGRYIAFLDADDEWTSDKLQVQLAQMYEQGAGFSYTGFWRVNGARRHRVDVPIQVTRKGLLFGNCIGCLTVVYDRSILGSVPMPDLPMRQDYALWLQLLEKVPAAHGVTQPLGLYHCTQNSLSSNKLRALQATWRMYRMHLNVGRFWSVVYCVSHSARRLWRG